MRTKFFLPAVAIAGIAASLFVGALPALADPPAATFNFASTGPLTVRLNVTAGQFFSAQTYSYCDNDTSICYDGADLIEPSPGSPYAFGVAVTHADGSVSYVDNMTAKLGTFGFSCASGVGSCWYETVPTFLSNYSLQPGDNIVLFYQEHNTEKINGAVQFDDYYTWNLASYTVPAPQGSLTVSAYNSQIPSQTINASWSFSATPGATDPCTVASCQNISGNTYGNLSFGGNSTVIYDISPYNGPSGYVLRASPSSRTLSSGNTSGSFAVLADPRAGMSLSATSLSLSTTTTSGQITISNTGTPGSELQWSASAPIYSPNAGGNQWLSLSSTGNTLTNGAAGNATESVTLTANTLGLADGTYTATTTINGSSLVSCSNDGVDCSLAAQKITVTLKITGSLAGGPVIVNSPTSTPVGDPVSGGCSGGTGTGYQWSTSGNVGNPASGSGSSFTVTFNQTGTSTVSCSDGSDSGSGTIFVYGPQCTSFTPSPATIIPPQQSKLSWNCTNTVSCTINGAAVANPLNGSLYVAPVTSTTYTLKCQGPGSGPANTVSLTTQVIVQGPGVIEINP